MAYRLRLHDYFLEFCRNTPDKIFLVFNGDKYTYEEAFSWSAKFSAFLSSYGASKKTHVTIFLENSSECIFSIIGCILCGAPFSVIDRNIKSEKLRFILQNSESRFLVTSPKNHNFTPEFFKENGIILIENFSSKIQTISDKHVEQKIIPTDLASIIYTSGSTGQPKGVVHTHLSMSFAAQSIISYLKNDKNDKILSSLPLSFDYGLYQLLMCMSFGGTLILERNFVFASKIFEKIEKFRCTGLPIVPSISSILTKSYNKDYDLSSVRYITNTAAHLDSEQINKLKAFFPEASIFPMYGLTECKRVSFLPPKYLESKPNSVGIPIPNTDVKILRDDGLLMDRGEGELVVRGPHIMRGYWKNETETQKKLFVDQNTKEIFLKTGDVFDIDQDGFLYFLCRKDEIIKVKSKKVSLFEVEEKTKEAFSIRDVCAISFPDKENDNKIVVFYSEEELSEITSDMIRRLNEILEPHCIPSEYIGISKIPKSTNGKNDKNTLKNHYYSSSELA